MDLFGIKKERRRRELWAALAGDYGGGYHQAKGFWNRKNERIEITVRGIAIVLDTYVVSTGKTQHSYTRVRGQFARGPGPKLRVVKKTMLSSLGQLLGFQDHEIGDPQFDDTFVIKSDSAALAHRLWSENAMATMLSQFQNSRIRSDREGIELIDSGVWNERQRMEHGLFLIAELAGRDLYGVERLQRVAEVSRDRDGWPAVALDTGVRVVIRAEVAGDRLVMVARTTERPPIAECSIAIADGALVEPAQAARLPQAAHVPLRSIGSGTLTVAADGASFAWQGLEVEDTAMRAGAELIGAIATAATAYR